MSPAPFVHVGRWLLLAALGFAHGVAAEIAGPDVILADDGWHQYRVAAASYAPDMCCHEWRGGVPVRVPCELDGRRGGSHLDTDQRDSGNPLLAVYVQTRDGEVQRLLALSADCPIEVASPVADLGEVPPAASAAWLAGLSMPADGSGDHLASRAIAALAAHDGPAPARHLAALVERGPSRGTRKSAMFWLAQYGFEGAERVLRRALDAEGDALRKHAVFALSRLPAPRGTDALVRLLEDRSQATDDRKQAIFWLAQIEDDRALDYLARLLGAS